MVSWECKKIAMRRLSSFLKLTGTNEVAGKVPLRFIAKVHLPCAQSHFEVAAHRLDSMLDRISMFWRHHAFIVFSNL